MMELTGNIAQHLDAILQTALQTKNARVIYQNKEGILPLFLLDSLGNILEREGLAKHLGGNMFDITEDGFTFIMENSFTARYQNNLEEEERKRLEVLLTKKKLAAANREPFYLAWSILATLASLILGYLHLIK